MFHHVKLNTPDNMFTTCNTDLIHILINNFINEFKKYLFKPLFSMCMMWSFSGITFQINLNSRIKTFIVKTEFRQNKVLLFKI